MKNQEEVDHGSFGQWDRPVAHLPLILGIRNPHQQQLAIG
jgi:hypothetical protein